MPHPSARTIQPLVEGLEVRQLLATSAGPADILVAPTALPTPLGVGQATPAVGQLSTLVFAIQNTSTNAAGDVVATIDLSGLPAGSSQSIRAEIPARRAGTTSSLLPGADSPSVGQLTPVAGRPGVEQLDFGPLAPEATATIVVSVIVGSGPSLAVLVAASDVTATSPDPTPANNLAYIASPVAATPSTTGPDLAVTVDPLPAALPLQVNQTTVLTFHVTNASTTAAVDAVATIDLSTLASGSYTAIRATNPGVILGSPFTPTQPDGRTPGTARAITGQTGFYEVDLGPIVAGGTANIEVVLVPSGGTSLVATASAVDAGSPLPDSAPANNLAVFAGAVAPAPALTTASFTTASTVQVVLATAVPRAQAQKLTHYQLTTLAGTPIRIHSAQYNARQQRVVLSLARPLPVGTTQARLTITGLGSDATLALINTRKGRR